MLQLPRSCDQLLHKKEHSNWYVTIVYGIYHCVMTPVIVAACPITLYFVYELYKSNSTMRGSQKLFTDQLFHKVQMVCGYYVFATFIILSLDKMAPVTACLVSQKLQVY